MTSRRLLYIFLGALTLLRLIYITLVDLSPDEAYYFMWSQRMDFCYYSKGPGVAAAIWLGTHLFGVNEFGVRVFSPLLALGTSLVMAAFARRLYGESVALWTVIAFNCIPIFEVGALVMTIDPLSIFFWMAALYTFWLALERSPENSRWWPATGALIGLGFLCKWTNAVQLLCIVLLLAFTPKYRREFRRAGFWIMLGIALLCAIPPIIWNAQHAWITLVHLTVRGHLEKAVKINPGEFLTFLLMHFGVYSPLIFGAMLAAAWWGLKRARTHFKPRFLLWFALPLFAFYAWLALRSAGEPNWTAPASLSLCLLTVALWHELSQTRRWARRYAAWALGLGAFISIITLNTDLIRRLGVPLSYDRELSTRDPAAHLAKPWLFRYVDFFDDPSARLRGWRDTADVVVDFRKQFEAQTGQGVFLIADKYQLASELAFYMSEKRPEAPGHPPVYIPESQNLENQFSFWPRYDEVTDLAEVARQYLAEANTPDTNPQLREQVAQTLAALTEAEKSNPANAPDAKRALVRALHQAAPKLPLDESFVEEQGPNLFAGRTALYLTDRGEDRAPSAIQQGFERAEMIACIDITRRGLPLRQLRIFACYNYHGMSL